MAKKTIYEYELEITSILDGALHDLSPASFRVLLDGMEMLAADYEDIVEERDGEQA